MGTGHHVGIRHDDVREHEEAAAQGFRASTAYLVVGDDYGAKGTFLRGPLRVLGESRYASVGEFRALAVRLQASAPDVVGLFPLDREDVGALIQEVSALGLKAPVLVVSGALLQYLKDDSYPAYAVGSRLGDFRLSGFSFSAVSGLAPLEAPPPGRREGSREA